jgi:hypothetical protein
MDIVRWAKDMVTIDCATPTYPMQMPVVSGNDFILGISRRVSAPTTEISRKLRAFNIAASIIDGNAYRKIVEGMSAHHPAMSASENMAALAACIRGAACGVNTLHPYKIKSILAVLDVNNGKRPNWVDAHAIMMIEGRGESRIGANYRGSLLEVSLPSRNDVSCFARNQRYPSEYSY